MTEADGTWEDESDWELADSDVDTVNHELSTYRTAIWSAGTAMKRELDRG